MINDKSMLHSRKESPDNRIVVDKVVASLLVAYERRPDFKVKAAGYKRVEINA